MRSILFVLAPLLAANPAAAQKPGSPGADTSGVYELSAVTSVPSPVNLGEFLQALETRYPPALRAAGTGGIVQVRMRVDARGKPHNLVVVSSTDAAFDQPTLDAVGELRFAPATLNGRPVQVWVQLPIHWTVGMPAAEEAVSKP